MKIDRRMVLASGGKLSVRNFLELCIAIGGNILIVRFLGLKLYGLQGVSAFFISLLLSIADPSIGLYLIRTAGKLDERRAGTAFLMLATLGAGTFLGGTLLVGPALAWWYHDTWLFWLICGSAAGILLTGLGRLPMVLLERDMKYGLLSGIELAGIVGYYLPAALGAYLGFGVISLIVGDLCKSILNCALAWRMKPKEFRVRPIWDREIAREILAFGIPTSVSGWIWMLAAAINPVLIGKWLGLEAAGLVRLAQGICNQLSFFSSIIARLSLNVFGKIQTESDRVLRALDQSALYNYFLLTMPLFLFAGIASWAVPFLYGSGSASVAPYLLVAVFPQAVNFIFAGQSYLLMASGHSRVLIKLHVVRSLGLWATCFILMPYFKVFAVPIGEFLVMPVFLFLDQCVRREYGAPSYRDSLILVTMTYTATLIAWRIGVIVIAPLLLLVALLISILLLSAGARSSLKEAIVLGMQLIRPGELAGVR